MLWPSKATSNYKSECDIPIKLENRSTPGMANNEICSRKKQRYGYKIDGARPHPSSHNWHPKPKFTQNIIFSRRRFLSNWTTNIILGKYVRCERFPSVDARLTDNDGDQYRITVPAEANVAIHCYNTKLLKCVWVGGGGGGGVVLYDRPHCS